MSLYGINFVGHRRAFAGLTKFKNLCSGQLTGFNRVIVSTDWPENGILLQF